MLICFFYDHEPYGYGKCIPGKFIETAKLLCLEFKPSETYCLFSVDGHNDMFYSHVVDDELRSPGVKYLQRYFVKVDKNCVPLHPNSSSWFKVMPWRVTVDYFVRSNNHIFDWKHQTNLVPVAYFQKLIGLIYDAGCNRTAHEYLKNCLLFCEERYPGISDYSRSMLDLSQVGLTMSGHVGSDIEYLMSDLSFKFVCSKFCPLVASVSKKHTPNFK